MFKSVKKNELWMLTQAYFVENILFLGKKAVSRS